MTLSLYVDGPRWRGHLKQVMADHPGLVPVAKGNGYGFGVARLARRAAWLGCDLLAVGTYAEVHDALRRFPGDVLVLEPFRPFLPDLAFDRRIVHTVGRHDDLVALARHDRPRVVLEGLSSMRRHGFDMGALASFASGVEGVHVEGHALHLPLGNGHLGEVERWLAAAPARRWFVSHVGASELARLATNHPDVELRPRIGTNLWLGDRAALRPRAHVLDVHRVRRGDTVGYRRRRVWRDGHLLVLSGGTAHGVAMEAPSAAASTRHRAVSLAKGGLDAVGRTLSPFVVAGRQRWFVEPPHMQQSMVLLPDSVPAPAVGDEVEVQVRYTTTLFDRVVVS